LANHNKNKNDLQKKDKFSFQPTKMKKNQLFCSFIFFFVSLKSVSSFSPENENVRHKKKSSPGPKFIAGRIPPGGFEHSDLNGMYRPREAAKLCEKDLACAGFTFKGTPLNIGLAKGLICSIYVVLNCEIIRWTSLFSKLGVYLFKIKS
jgi:hypothetical protein